MIFFEESPKKNYSTNSTLMHKIADFERPSFNRSAAFLSMLFSKNMLELLFLVSQN